MSEYLSQSDLDTRLQQSYCAAGTLAYKTDKEYRYGLQCANKHLEDLFLVTALIEILECYTPLDPQDPDPTQNCISEPGAQRLFEEISRTCNICFDTITNSGVDFNGIFDDTFDSSFN